MIGGATHGGPCSRNVGFPLASRPRKLEFAGLPPGPAIFSKWTTGFRRLCGPEGSLNPWTRQSGIPRETDFRQARLFRAKPLAKSLTEPGEMS